MLKRAMGQPIQVLLSFMLLVHKACNNNQAHDCIAQGVGMIAESNMGIWHS